jgi:hypothetical protein
VGRDHRTGRAGRVLEPAPRRPRLLVPPTMLAASAGAALLGLQLAPTVGYNSLSGCSCSRARDRSGRGELHGHRALRGVAAPARRGRAGQHAAGRRRQRHGRPAVEQRGGRGARPRDGTGRRGAGRTAVRAAGRGRCRGGRRGARRARAARARAGARQRGCGHFRARAVARDAAPLSGRYYRSIAMSVADAGLSACMRPGLLRED